MLEPEVCILTLFTHFSHSLSSAFGSHWSVLCIYELDLFLFFYSPHVSEIMQYVFLCLTYFT